MLYENWWHSSFDNKQNIRCPPLTKNIAAECVVIGGGFAGLHAALRLVEGGKEVILLEKTICGGSSSGQSAGFITPESEENAEKLIKRYGKEKAEKVYKIPTSGVDLIIGTIKKYNLPCDMRKQDSLYLSIKPSHDSSLEEEAHIKKKFALPYTLLDKKQLQSVHPGRGYTKGLRYPGSYGINSYAYCQEMKNLLIKKGAQVYEGTEVRGVHDTTVKTALGSVRARHILICIDKMKSEFNEEFSKHYYHFQVHAGVSEPLSASMVKSMFPQGECMCWDTRWDYAYYRIIEDNRLFLGCSSLRSVYTPDLIHSPSTINTFIKELKMRFPSIKESEFTHYWSGLIDVTRDLTPIADYDHHTKSIQYAMGCAGLPWAAFCGDYLARRVLNPKKTEDLSAILGVHRKHFLPMAFQSIFGKRITFGLSHIHQLFS